VVFVQLLALGYGIYTVDQARSVVTALEGSRFRVVTAIAVQSDELDRAPGQLKNLSLTGPVLVNTAEPAGVDKKLDAIMMAMAGADIGFRPSYWLEWDDQARQIIKTESKPLLPLMSKQYSDSIALFEAIARSGWPVDQLRYMPLLARKTD
jgi:hypothetical protein